MGYFEKIAEALRGLGSMVTGLRITGSNFMKPQVTVHYPRQEVDTLATFRGHVELVPSDEDPAQSRCVGCGLCAELCPSNCLRVVAEDPPVDSGSSFLSQAGTEMLMPTPRFRVAPPSQTPTIRKLLGHFLTYHTCSLCGLCAQNCPSGALRFSKNVYLAGDARENFEIDLMARLRRQAEQGGNPHA